MTDHVLVRWKDLPLVEFINLFRDAVHLPADSEDIGPGKMLFRFSDAVGNTAFAVATADRIASFGSVLLERDQAYALDHFIFSKNSALDLDFEM